ncbi:MAG: N,N-dimethylformamidase beta subunit family domain-containing protein [Bacteroidota bacterium]
MKKRSHIWSGLILFFSVGMMPALLAFAMQFHFLFPLSHRLFQLQHNAFDHLEFHTDRYDYQVGDTVKVFFSSGRSDSITLSLHRVDSSQTLVQQSTHLGLTQRIPSRSAVSGTTWDDFAAMPISPAVGPGWYTLAIDNGKEAKRQSVFVQPTPGRVQRKVALIFSTNTWNAYNDWGGQSLYSANYTSLVSFLRPQPASDPYLPNRLTYHQLYHQAANQDRNVWDLLHLGDATPDGYSMERLHEHDPRLLEYSVWIFSTHPEYWSREMMHHLNAFLDRGGSALFLAGNVAAYLADLNPPQQSLQVFRRKQDFWEFADTTGIRPFGTQASQLGFHTYSPYEVVNDTSWVWDGLGIQKGDLIGKVSDSYDYTFMYDHWWEMLASLRMRGKKGAASGMEIDKIYAGTPSNWVSLASGFNPALPGHGEVYPDPAVEWEPGGGADMGYYLHPGGGMVFHASSMSFTGAFKKDGQLRTMVRHVLERCLSFPSPQATP